MATVQRYPLAIPKSNGKKLNPFGKILKNATGNSTIDNLLSTAGEYVTDAGLAYADNELSIFGASDLISDDNYNTKAGKSVTQVTNPLYKTLGQAAATYLGGPAAGMGMSTIQQGIGSLTNKDEPTGIEKGFDVINKLGSTAMSGGQDMASLKGMFADGGGIFFGFKSSPQ